MKSRLIKNGLALLSLLLLCSCGKGGDSSIPSSTSDDSSSSSSTYEDDRSYEFTDEMLEEAQQGYKARTLVKLSLAAFGDTYYYVDSAASDDYYEFAMYDSASSETSASKSSVSQSGLYSTDSKGILSQIELGLDNKLNYIQLVDSSGFLLNWKDAGYSNFFEDLYPDDFVETEDDFCFALRDNVKSKIRSSIGLQLSLSSTLDIQDMILKTDGYKIVSCDITFEEYTSTYGKVTPSATVVFEGLGEGLITVPEAYEGEEDSLFQSKLESLKSQNYKLEVSALSKTMNCLVEDGKVVVYDIYNKGVLSGSYGYYQSTNSTVQGLLPAGDYYYYDAEPISGLMTQMLPTFNISSAIFDKRVEGESYIYELKDGLEGYTKDSQAYGMFGGDVCGDLTIEFNSSDEIIVTNTNNGVVETFRYYDIGKVDGLSEKIINGCDTAPWSDLFQTQTAALAKLLQKIPQNVLDEIPNFGGYYSYVVLNVDKANEYAFVLSNSNYTYDLLQEIIESYEGSLVANGYVASSEKGRHKGDVYVSSKKYDIDGVQKSVQLEIYLAATYFDTPQIVVYPTLVD